MKTIALDKIKLPTVKVYHLNINSIFLNGKQVDRSKLTNAIFDETGVPILSESGIPLILE